MRTTTFGIGTRSELVQRNASPPPNTYTLSSDFDAKVQKGRVFSFGICREAYARVYIKAHPAPDRALPGPGLYEVREIPGKDALKYSLRPKTSAQCSVLPLIAQCNGRLSGPPDLEPTTSCPALVLVGTSSFHSFQVPGRPVSIRHGRHASRCNVSTTYSAAAKEARLAPGPGHYEDLKTMDKNGVYPISKYQSSRCRRFGHERRGWLPTAGRMLDTPGPGSYRSPSEFGHYQAKERLVRESQRLEERRLTRTTVGKPRDSRTGLPSGHGQTSQAMMSTFSSTKMTHSASQPDILNAKNSPDTLELK